MKVLFLDTLSRSYDTRTPLTSPLGGTQSAVAYLSAEMVRQGHQVAVINGGTEPREVDGVRFLTLPCPIVELNSYDVMVIVSMAIGGNIRSVGYTGPMVLWCHTATDQQAVQPLHDPVERSHYAGFALVSQWQAATYHKDFGIPAETMRLMRNAVAPSFLTSTPGLKWLKEGTPPVLAYSSTPFRGLDLLLLSFSAIRARLDGARLRVFSSMGIYERDHAQDHAFSSLYELARALPGVEFVGPLPQPKLAEAMAEVDIWAYPCTFPETSCIAAMEAMASGTCLVSTTMGALPETTMGFAHLLDLGDLSRLDGGYAGMIATYFAQGLLTFTEAARAKPQTVLERVAIQMEVTRTSHTWSRRASEWADWLQTLA